MTLTALFKKIMGDPVTKMMKAYQPRVDQINALESTYDAFSDEELKAKTAVFRQALESGKSLDDLLVEAFACVREASKRVLKMRHFDVQLVGGMVLHEGCIAEMKTGEGKTLMSTLPAYLNALEGKGVYIVTVNDYLAKRDSEWMGQIFSFLGLSVGLIQANMPPEERLSAYECDITYGTNNEFGFDYLRDHLAGDLSHCCQLRRHFAIIDEVDSILIDEARTPLIISGPVKDSTEKYIKVARVAKRLSIHTHFTSDEKHKNIVLTEEGIDRIEKDMGLSDMYSVANMDAAHMAVQCLKALHLYKRDVDYVVNDGQVLIVDEFTGRLMEGRRYSDGLHQAIEAVEGLVIREESQTLASITFQNYFRMFPKLAGMTGTAVTEAAEFGKIYGLPVVVIPTNKPLIREDCSDVIYKTRKEKFNAIVNEIARLHEKGQPVLVGTIAIETSELMSTLLKKRGIVHHVLNAKHHEKEAEIIANAGQKGSVTIATNMAGRGTDIVLGDGVVDNGGLFVIGSGRHESRRIDNQLRGRSGRQGDPGRTRFYVSLEDDLMKLFGSDRIMKMMDALGMPDDMPIEHKLVSRSLEKAQTKVEKYHFGIRKQILEYDDVLNKQRETVYRLRDSVLEKANFDSIYGDFLTTILQSLAVEFPVEDLKDAEISGDFSARFQQILPIKNVEDVVKEIVRTGSYECIQKVVVDFYLMRKAEHPEGVFDSYVTKPIVLMTLDKKWMDHLHNMDVLREGIGLRAYGQRDPLLEYKREGYDMFQALMFHLAEEVLTMVNRTVVVPQETTESAIDVTALSTNQQSSSAPSQVKSTSKKLGRNDKVTISKEGVTKEVKWKVAEPLIQQGGWTLVSS